MFDIKMRFVPCSWHPQWLFSTSGGTLCIISDFNLIHVVQSIFQILMSLSKLDLTFTVRLFTDAITDHMRGVPLVGIRYFASHLIHVVWTDFRTATRWRRHPPKLVWFCSIVPATVHRKINFINLHASVQISKAFRRLRPNLLVDVRDSTQWTAASISQNTKGGLEMRISRYLEITRLRSCSSMIASNCFCQLYYCISYRCSVLPPEWLSSSTEQYLVSYGVWGFHQTTYVD